MRLEMGIAVLVAAVPLLGPGRATALSFACAKASTPTEFALCADTRLWPLDNEFGKAVRRELDRHPDQRDSILRKEREWLSERDRECPAEALNDEPFHLCLIDAYQKRLATFSAATPLELKQELARELEKKTRLCKIIADAYRPLANSHPGEAPLQVLAKSTDSPIKLASKFVPIQQPVTDVSNWAAAQNPPFTLSPNLQKKLKQYAEYSGGDVTLIKALGVDFYTIGRIQGSMGCGSQYYYPQ